MQAQVIVSATCSCVVVRCLVVYSSITHLMMLVLAVWPRPRLGHRTSTHVFFVPSPFCSL